MDRNNFEILSPAGDMERLLSAVTFGCDAVYLAGKKFGMRSSPSNFNDEDLEKAISIAHNNGVKVYITCNTIIKSNEIKELKDFIIKSKSFTIDGFIVADIGVMQLIKKYAPDTDIHISTQAGVVNYETARAFWNMGAKRVVLARELSLDEIKEIRSKTNKNLELEAFVHGAMCMSFSGRCLISNYLTNRDANNGDCCQPCRWKYYVVEETRPNEYFPIEQTKEGTYLFNSRDMCMIEHLPELIDAGITSFKIEGRAKSAYYVAVVTNAYKNALLEYIQQYDKKNYKLSSWISDEVNKISHREYSTGFYFKNEPGQIISNGGYIREYDVVAVIKECKNDMIKVLQRNKFSVGDIINILPINDKPVEITVTEIYDEYFNSIETANKAAQIVYIKSNNNRIFLKDSLMRKKR